MMRGSNPMQAFAFGKAVKLFVAGIGFWIGLGIVAETRLFAEDIPTSPESADLEPLPDAPKKGPTGSDRFESLPDVDPSSPRFQYRSGAMRDPFLSFVDPSERDLSGVPPLQRVAVSELKLIGVAWGSGRISAMLQTPDGKTYPVHKGTRVGNNRGRIGHVGEASITIEEPYLNIFGRTALRQVVMKLYTKKEE